MTLRLFLRASALLWGITLVAALAVVVIPGAGPAAREAFGFRLDATERGSLSDAASYFTTNVRVLAAILLAGWARSRTVHLAPLLDALVGTVILVNAAVVGTALGAYGMPTVRWLLHLPLEWAAFALGLAAYSARWKGQRSLGPAFITVPALGLASVVESYAAP